MTINLNSFYMALLLTASFATHAEIQLGQDKVRLLEKYQLELHDLKIKVVQLETEVFLGGYHDLIERYQEIIKQLEYDVKVANDDSIPYSYLSQKLRTQQSEIDELSSTISWNNFFLLISMLFSVVAITRITNQ
jgi:translation initiation factor 2 beta subunit (eIF-2beta)/eIF-5